MVASLSGMPVTPVTQASGRVEPARVAVSDASSMEGAPRGVERFALAVAVPTGGLLDVASSTHLASQIGSIDETRGGSQRASGVPGTTRAAAVSKCRPTKGGLTTANCSGLREYGRVAGCDRIPEFSCLLPRRSEALGSHFKATSQTTVVDAGRSSGTCGLSDNSAAAGT